MFNILLFNYKITTFSTKCQNQTEMEILQDKIIVRDAHMSIWYPVNFFCVGKQDAVHYYNDGVLSGFVEEHLACRISALGTRKKRVPWIPSAVFSGKYTARISSRDATYENYLSARLFRTSRESRKVRRPGVFIFSTALQIRAARACYQNLL